MGKFTAEDYKRAAQEYAASLKKGHDEAQAVKQEAVSAGTWPKKTPTVPRNRTPAAPKETAGNGFFSEYIDKATPSNPWISNADVNLAPRSSYASASARSKTAKDTLDSYLNSPEGQSAIQEEEALKERYRTEVSFQPTLRMEDMPQSENVKRLRQLRKDAEDSQQIAENAQKAEHDQSVYDEDMREISGMTDAERQQLKDYVSVRDQGRTGNILTDLIYLPREKKKAAGSLWDKYGEARLNELAETYARDLHQQERQEVQQAAQDASQGVGGAVLTTVGGIAAKPIGSVMGLKGRLDELGQSTGRYSTLDPYTAGDAINTFTDAAKQNVQQQIEGDGSNVFRKGAAVLYQAGTGTVENVLGAITLGPGVTAAVNATGQLTRTISEASDRGATAGQAYLLATSSAALDYAMDKIPLDNLFGLAKSGSTSALKAAFKQAGIEMTTEGASFIGSQLLDMAILQQNSEYAQNVQNYREQGMNQQDAVHQANKDLVSQAGQQLLVAGISGGVSAGVSTAIGNARNRRTQAQQTRLDAEATPDTTPAAAPEQSPDLPRQDAAPTETTPEAHGAQLPQNPQQLPTQEPASSTDTVSNLVREATTRRQQQQEAARQSIQNQTAALTGGQEPAAPYTGTENSASAEPSVGAADQNFTGTARYQDLLSDDNVKPDRRDDFRGDEVPKMDGSQRVSDVAKNLIGSKNTTDAGADQVKQLIDSGVFSYDPKSNKQSLQEAYDDLNVRGTQRVRNEILNHLVNNTVEDGDVTKAVVLANQYIQSGDEASAAEMMSDLSLLAQKSGRNLQLFSLIRRMTPEGQLNVLQQAADKMLSQGKQPKESRKRGASNNSDASGRPKTSLTHADIPVELKNQYIEAARSKDTAKIDAATRAIAQAVGSQYQATFKEKWDTWRYMCMLGNASTNVRNIAGNAMFKPYTVVKDELAAIFEKALPQDQRTKAMHTDKDLLAWAKEDTKSVDAQNALKYSAKMGDDVTSDIMSENKRIFKSGALETARKVAEWAPSAGDMIFKNGYYAKYLANFLTARGISADDVRAGKVDTDVMAQARQYAVNNAYINTFNDRNNFSDAVASLGSGKSSTNPVTRAFGTAVDAILPFRRTPANILVRFKEYSPVEVIAAAAKISGKGLDKVSKGKYGWGREYTASQFCNDLASGLTGTGVLVLGSALGKGIFNSKGDGVRLITKATDEEKLQGKQDYSIEVTLNGKTHSASVEWAAPANLPLFVGANLSAAAEKSKEEDADFVDRLINFGIAAKDTLEPVLSLSCLSSLNDLLENVKYSGDGEHIYTIAASAATSYLTQAIPSLLRQTSTLMQTEKQTTFANDDRKEVRGVQRALSNIPFVGDALGLKTDKIDVWGQKQSTGSVAQRAFNAYLNPSKISKVTSDATTAELERLSKTEYGTGVTPELAPKTLTYTDKQGVTHKDVRLTAQQWEAYATTRGQTSKQILDKLVKSSDYAKLGDAGKAAAIDLVYKYADKTGAIKAMSDHDGYPDSWMQEAADSKNPGAYIVQKVNNQQMKTAMDNLTKAWAHKTDRPAAKQDLEAAYDTYSKSSADVQKAVMDAAEGAVKQYMEARADGFNSNVSLSIIKQVQSIPQKNRQKVAYQYQAVANTKGLSEAQLDKAMKLYMPDYDPSAKKPVKTEVKYDYIRQELGFSAKEYAKAAYAMQDMSYDEDDSESLDKDEQIKALMGLGYDKSTATKFYQIYQGSSNSAKAALKKFIEENY